VNAGLMVFIRASVAEGLQLLLTQITLMPIPNFVQVDAMVDINHHFSLSDETDFDEYPTIAST